MRSLLCFARPGATNSFAGNVAGILVGVKRVTLLSALLLAATTSTPAAAPPPPCDVDVGAAVPSVDVIVTTTASPLALPIKELLAERFDVAALPPGTAVTIWRRADGRRDDDIVGFRVHIDGRDGVADVFTALRADTHAGGGAVFVDSDGVSLAGDTLASPVDAWAVSSRVGERIHPITHRKRFHAGTDYAAPVGTPVVVVRDGVVTKSARLWSAGRFVVVRHDDKSESKYFHLDERLVEAGQRLKKGDLVGVVGKTGRVTGPHLHFELRDARGVPVDMAAERWPGTLRVDDAERRALALRVRLLDDAGLPRWCRDLSALPAARVTAVDLDAVVDAVVDVARVRAAARRGRRRASHGADRGAAAARRWRRRRRCRCRSRRR